MKSKKARSPRGLGVQKSPLSSSTPASLGLTLREGEVLFWVAQGKSNAEVALILRISPLTVRTHLERVYRKLRVENRTAATLKALESLGKLKR